MRNLIKCSLNVFMLIGLSALLFSCEKDAKYKEYVYPIPTVDEIYPVSAYIGSRISISGTDFGDRMEAVKVFFGGIEAENIISCKNNRIIVEVSADAQSGDVSLQVWTHTLESVGQFTVIPTPSISSISSDREEGFATGGDEIIINGTAFGNVKEEVKVTINNKEAEIVSVMDNAIKVIVPEDYGSGLVIVTIKGYEVTGPALIDPNKKGDVTELFLKNYKQPFQRGDTEDGEWGTALYWSFNGNFNSANSLQFTDDVPEGLLSIVGHGKWDGACYQLATLPAGTYTFTVNVAEDLKGSGRYGVRFVVGKGETDFPALTDKGAPWYFADRTNVLCDVLISNKTGTVPTVYTCSMTLDRTTEVRIGFATMMAASNTVKISSIQIDRE